MSNTEREVFDTPVCALILIDFILSLIIWLSWFGKINLFPFYSVLNIFLFPMWAVFCIWTLLIIRKKLRDCSQENQEKTKEKEEKQEEPKKKDCDSIGRAWKYAKHASELYMGNVHFFLVAESMLLLSFVTIYTMPDRLIVSEIQLAIAVVGFLITFYWFYENVRLSKRLDPLYKWLKKDPIYCEYLKYVRGLSGRSVIAFMLPITFILLWVFLFLYRYNDNQIDLDLLTILSFSIIVLIILSIILDRFLKSHD